MTTQGPDYAQFQAGAHPAAAKVTPDQVKAALAAIFPSATITDDIVNDVLNEMRAPGSSGARAAAALHAPDLAASLGSGPPLSYYMANAQHARKRGTGSVFVGHLPLVRFSLPATGNFDTDPVPTIRTAIGDLDPGDRKIASVAMLPQFTDQVAERIDLLSPPRAAVVNARFGAVALYLCYAHATDDRPSFYILEAGTATGDAMVLFMAQGMAPIPYTQTAYQPTPFSKPTNYYTGTLTMSALAPDEPDTVVITSTDTSGQGPDAGNTPYIVVTLQYQKLLGPPVYDPVGLTLQAAARVGLIGRAIDVDPGVTENIAAVLLGWTLQWDSPPGTPPPDGP
jgi:hypothetical protein